MAVQTYENIQRLPPFLEGLQKRLLQSAFGTFDGEAQTAPGLLDRPLGLPGIQIAGTDPLTARAAQLGEEMVGQAQPFLQGAADQSLAAQQALTSGLGFLQPESISRFQNPFQDQVIDVALRELDRQADMRRAGQMLLQSGLELLVAQEKACKEQRQKEDYNRSKAILYQDYYHKDLVKL